jgi:hypothetical protein
MKRLALMYGLVCLAGVALASVAGAQGLQTGTLSGSVKDQQALVLPGVTVTATSSALQGARTAVTDANGLYTMPGLPPGTYTVEFELQGMATMRREATVVPLGGVASVDATMGVATLAETVRVTAETPSVLASPTGQANFNARELNSMPIGRTPFRIAELAPGLTDNAPNIGQLTISGGFAYDNIFMIDGVDVNDNLFGTAHNVFIEDAIDETSVLTSGISAEYGRFSGGVINLVTKRGGNIFSGGIRLNLTNPAWNDESPLEKSRGTKHVDQVSKFLEGTLGGPVQKDRLWFFFATRRERSQMQGTLAQVGTPVVTGVENDRYEIKLTGTPAASHTIQGSYVNNKSQDVNRPSLSLASSIDLTVLVTRQVPNRLFVTNYNGVVGSRTFVTAQYSEKIFGFRNTGGTSTALTDSPFRSRGSLPGTTGALHYHAPFFSALDPEDRNNRQYAGSVAYFLTTRATGSHNLKAGAEHFTSSRLGGNSQSATGYVFLSDYRTTAAGIPAYDAQGRIIPRFVPNVSQVQNWLSTVGAEMDVTTLSLYVQDHWTASSRLSLDLGVRIEKVNSNATGDIVGADTGSIVPRLGLTFDPIGDGKTVLQATYSHYSGKYSDVQYARNTAVGSPSRITYNYTGPEGEGFDFASGMSLANYTTVASGNFPTANVFFADGLGSPLTKEVTLSAGREIGRGHARIMYTWRKASNFLDDFIDDPSPAGKISVIRDGVNFGTFDRLEYRNSNEVVRDYQGLQLVGRYRLMGNLTLDGNYTAQLKNHGNFEGEAANQPANPSDFGDYPQVLSAERNFPYGRLNDFQRHKLRLWAVYNQSLGRAGSIDIAPLWKYNSAQTYSLATASTSVPLSAIQSARNASLGYARLAGGGFQTLYFDERGTEEFAGYGVVDLAVSYQVPVWRTVRPWIKFELFNVMNNNKLIAWTTTVTPDATSPLDVNGLPTGYVKATNFGTARSNADYPRPLPGIDGGRAFAMAFGLRF